MVNAKTTVKGRNLFTKVKTARSRKVSSASWLQRHFNDPYVIQSKRDGYRARSAYKLLEIDEKFNLLKKRAVVLDLGAAPGSWAQVALNKGATKVIGVDLLAIEPIHKAEFIMGDFSEDTTLDKIKALLVEEKITLILSDMAPNTSGHKTVDHVKIVVLCEAVFEFAKENLAEGGSLVMKLFQGGADGELLQEIKRRFTSINHFKPDSSRKASSETYLVALGFKL
jgi:23S rRNA (uridine2552-2'-O)-methyltransferase